MNKKNKTITWCGCGDEIIEGAECSLCHEKVCVNCYEILKDETWNHILCRDCWDSLALPGGDNLYTLSESEIWDTLASPYQYRIAPYNKALDDEIVMEVDRETFDRIYERFGHLIFEKEKKDEV